MQERKKEELEQEEQLDQSPASKKEAPEDPSVTAILALLQDPLVRNFISKYRLNEINAEGKHGILTDKNKSRMEFCTELAELMLRYVEEVNKENSADPNLSKATIEQITLLANALKTFGETKLAGNLNLFKPIKPCKAILERKYIYLPETEAFALLIEQVINPAIQFLEQALAGSDGWFNAGASTAISLVLGRVGFAGISSFNDLFNPINNYYSSTFALIKQINQDEMKLEALQRRRTEMFLNGILTQELEDLEQLGRDITTFKNLLISDNELAQRLKILKEDEYRFAEDTVIEKQNNLIHEYAALVTNTEALLEGINIEIAQERVFLEEEQEKSEENEAAEDSDGELEFFECEDDTTLQKPKALKRQSIARKPVDKAEQEDRIKALEEQIQALQQQAQESQELRVQELQERQEQARQTQTIEKTREEIYIAQRDDFKKTNKLLDLTDHTDELITKLTAFIERLDLIGLALLAKDIGFPMNREDHKDRTVQGKDLWLTQLRLNKGFYKYAQSWFGQTPTYGATNRSKKVGDIIKQCAKVIVKRKDNLDDEEQTALNEILTFNRKRGFRQNTKSIKELKKDQKKQQANGTNDERGRSSSRSSDSEDRSSSSSPLRV